MAEVVHHADYSNIFLNRIYIIKVILFFRIPCFSRNHVLQTCLYVMELLVGYGIMLTVMTFSGWLFLAIILGSGIGYHICQAFCYLPHTTGNVKCEIRVDHCSPTKTNGSTTVVDQALLNESEPVIYDDTLEQATLEGGQTETDHLPVDRESKI